MTAQGYHRRVGWQWRDALLALALFAAVVRAMVPQGFMLTTQDGTVAISICTVDGARTLNGTTRNDGGASDAMAGMQAPCAFAGLTAAMPPPDAPIVSIAEAVELRLVDIDETPLTVEDRQHRPQAPRAPPQLHA
jgi:hypothetical protein